MTGIEKRGIVSEHYFKHQRLYVVVKSRTIIRQLRNLSDV